MNAHFVQVAARSALPDSHMATHPGGQGEAEVITFSVQLPATTTGIQTSDIQHQLSEARSTHHDLVVNILN